MATFNIKGLDEYSKKIQELGDKSTVVCKRATYAGADVVANSIKNALKTLPVQEGKNGLPPLGTPEKKIKGVSRKQKQDLIDSMGLAPIQNFKNDYICTKIGWDGYGSVPTKKYPSGVPNQMLMRSVESGTSFRQKTPVVRQATNKCKNPAMQAMAEEADKTIKTII